MSCLGGALEGQTCHVRRLHLEVATNEKLASHGGIAGFYSFQCESVIKQMGTDGLAPWGRS